MAVVLPEPWRPAISTTVGGRGEKVSPAEEPPISLVSSSLTILTTCWPGLSCLLTSTPRQRSFTVAVNCLTTLKLTSASSRARRISRIARLMSSSVSAPRWRTPASVPCSFSDSESNNVPHRVRCRAVELDLLVIGSGPSGQKAAIQAAKLGKRVAVAERKERLGGVSIHTGTIPSKTLREAVLEQLAQRPLDVLDPTRVEESEQAVLELLMDRTARVVAAETAVVREQFRRNRVGLLPGEARFEDANTVKMHDDDEPIRARRIIIACGHAAGAAVLGPVRRQDGHRLRRPAQARAPRAALDDRRRRRRDRRRVRLDVRRARDQGHGGRQARPRAQLPRHRDRRGLPVPAAAPERDLPAARAGRRRGPRRRRARPARCGWSPARSWSPRPCCTRSAARATPSTSSSTGPAWRPTRAAGSRSTRTTARPCRTSSRSATSRAAGWPPPRWSRAGSPRCTRSASRCRRCPSWSRPASTRCRRSPWSARPRSS